MPDSEQGQGGAADGGVGGQPGRPVGWETFTGGGVPFDGTLDAPTEAAQFPLILDAVFPNDAWDPTLLVQRILGEFAATDWRKWTEAEFGRNSYPTTEDGLRAEIESLLADRRLRGQRRAEILAQARSLELYWGTLLMIGPGRRNTAVVLSAAMAIGHLAGMHWKWHYKRARPVQLSPVVMPMIPTPAHPAFPSNHALQSHLIAQMLSKLVLPQSIRGGYEAAFDRLADRIGKNREVAGVHYPSDTRAGENLAKVLVEKMKEDGILEEEMPTLKEFVIRAEAEWADMKLDTTPIKLPAPEPSLAQAVAAAVVAELKKSPPPNGSDTTPANGV